MTTRMFQKILDDRLEEVKKVLRRKEKEYADDDDRLIQFRKAGYLLNTSPVRSLMGMMSKHTTSLYMMAENPTKYLKEQWHEKITDHIAYLVLLEAVLSDLIWRYEHDGEE